MSAAATTVAPSASSLRWLLRSNSAQARIARFMAIGWATTGLNWALFLIVRTALSATWATLIALVVSTLINTAAQRRYTFESAHDAKTARRDHIMSISVFGGAWLLSIWAIALLHSFVPDASSVAELVVAQLCTLCGSGVRFALLQAWNRR